ncbi:hypothetical protein DFJ73DRAFT_904192 [Zopfochytrium polystomum]|nr:hypothetical protein DFJ73DRAFT_904192 [Zopfochytrium polystomum]
MAVITRSDGVKNEKKAKTAILQLDFLEALYPIMPQHSHRNSAPKAAEGDRESPSPIHGERHQCEAFIACPGNDSGKPIFGQLGTNTRVGGAAQRMAAAGQCASPTWARVSLPRHLPELELIAERRMVSRSSLFQLLQRRCWSRVKDQTQERKMIGPFGGRRVTSESAAIAAVLVYARGRGVVPDEGEAKRRASGTSGLRLRDEKAVVEG